MDDAFLAQDVISREYSTFEECFVPDTFVRKIPEEYSNLPVLQGRATVEMVVQKADKSQFDVDGKLYNEIKLVMVLDGYNAPITAGNIVELVNNGFYNGKKVNNPMSIPINFSCLYLLHMNRLLDQMDLSFKLVMPMQKVRYTGMFQKVRQKKERFLSRFQLRYCMTSQRISF